MNSENQGLTVGELTITVGIVIIAVLVWANIAGNKESSQSLNTQASQISSLY